ncbi:MAG TPA: hydrogenase maturation protease [Kofleriaceae bacterium]|nr:hydrogenase maturation protease [Kofleriaceae bacterium]
MKRVLVAGVGNVFFGDDGFGVEVARQLAGPMPTGTRVLELGIRAVHFAFELLEPIDLLIVADCMARGGAPGTLYVVEPQAEAPPPALADAHGMNLSIVFATLQQLGGTLPPTRIVGCEPATIEPGIGLSTVVTHAIPGAIELIHDLISRQEAS